MFPTPREMAVSKIECFQRGLLVPVLGRLARRAAARKEYRALVLHECTPLRLLRRDALFEAFLCGGRTWPWCGSASDFERPLAGRLLLLEPRTSPLRALPRAGSFLLAPIYVVGAGGEVRVHPRVAYLALADRRFRVLDERYGGERAKAIEKVTTDDVTGHFFQSFGSFRLAWWTGNRSPCSCERGNGSAQARTDQGARLR